jgi:hypothetical protein
VKRLIYTYHEQLIKTVIFSTVRDELPITNYQSPITNYQSPITNHQSPITHYPLPTLKLRNLKALLTTETEEKAMAAPAMIGLSKKG